MTQKLRKMRENPQFKQYSLINRIDRVPRSTCYWQLYCWICTSDSPPFRGSFSQYFFCTQVAREWNKRTNLKKNIWEAELSSVSKFKLVLFLTMVTLKLVINGHLSFRLPTNGAQSIIYKCSNDNFTQPDCESSCKPDARNQTNCPNNEKRHKSRKWTKETRLASTAVV